VNERPDPLASEPDVAKQKKIVEKRMTAVSRGHDRGVAGSLGFGEVGREPPNAKVDPDEQQRRSA
jgi:hypothetical protein